MVRLPPRSSVLIVSWNGREHLPDCLDSLARQHFSSFEVVLVDNGSTDGSVELVRERYPWVRLVTLPENAGFAGGNNAGLRHCRGEYVVVLNNDTIADPAWLAELVRVADMHPEVGMVGCRICTWADPECLDTLGIKICVDGMSRGTFRGEKFSTLGLDRVVPILLPSGCAALYRKVMLDEIGFFDEDFFFYCEDTDLGLRGRLAGWEALLATDAVVLHKYSQTGGAVSPWKMQLVERNHYWVVVKNFPLVLLLALPLTSLWRFVQQAKAFFVADWRGSAKNGGAPAGPLVRAMLVGTAQAVVGFGRMFAKRRTAQKTRRLSQLQLWALLRTYHLSFRELFEHAR